MYKNCIIIAIIMLIGQAVPCSPVQRSEITIVIPPQIEVGGVVNDSTGRPLIGVCISLVGATNGTVTDIDGKFTIYVYSERSQLRFTYIGLRDRIITVGKQREFNLVMDPDRGY